ncbi:uncharacterized protein F4812DRAFT_413923 [Daldinia caldariorum]|uniref:uncharacterized protein n=1 Tax=Daldinia caldariorum TaxID=326644 RepID=UPI002008B3FB|nr:uncharacterized protein F4812DRAFT_413923 [Daldinia caldariorum]KAI1471399.1 hypothetical protein F4812DRAFT_413923 [Daldinia caldariorum]
MSKRAVKRKVDLEPLLDGPDVLVKETPKKKKTGIDKRLSRLEEYNEDEGRESSRNFQRWAEIFENNTKGEAMKSETFIKKFQVKVQKQVDKVRDYMQEQEKLLAQNNGKLVESFEDLYSATAFTHGSDDEARNASKEGHILFQDAQAVISRSYALLEKFKETDEQLKNCKFELPSAKWKQDKQDIKDLLSCGREYGEKLVEDKLAPMPQMFQHSNGHKADGKEAMTSELFKKSSKARDEEDTWGTVAAEQVKRFTVMAKSVPMDDVERVRR